jgi:toxin ParE1/3/4
VNVHLSPRIEPDLEVIAEYIADHNPTRAVSFVNEIRREFSRIGQAPLHYRARADLGKDIRMAVFGQYVILFRVIGDVVSIRRVVHGARDLKNLKR